MTDAIGPLAPNGGAVAGAGTSTQARPETRFSDMLEKVIGETAQNLEAADQATLQSSTGGPVDLHEVMIAMEKADISLRLLVQVRNKAVDAYQEIMRMQV